MNEITTETHPVSIKLKLAADITLSDYLLGTSQTTESLDKKYLDWRIAVEYPKYSMLSETIEDFVARLIRDEEQNGTRIIPNGAFLIYIQGKDHPGPFWPITINRTLFYGLNELRLR